MKSNYDVVIIGAGISGLISGSYLARAGLSVLIVEKHNQVGGYCTSFLRKGYIFDAAVHALGSIERGVLGKILSEIGVLSILKFDLSDPTDEIIMPEFKVQFVRSLEGTISNFCKVFPEEKENINKFFQFILQEQFINVYFSARNLTFSDFLGRFFKSNKLKATLSVLLANFGVPASRASAVAAIILYRQYLLDSGYHPRGGMSEFSRLIAEKFVEAGGDILLSAEVQTVVEENNEAKGVIVRDIFVGARAVISCVDVTQTFKKLVKKETKEFVKMNSLTVSPSAFVVYLGLRTNLFNADSYSFNYWKCASYNVINQVISTEEDLLREEIPLIQFNCRSVAFPKNGAQKRSVIEARIFVPYLTKSFFSQRKFFLSNLIIENLEKVIGGFRDAIEFQTTASPATFEKYTMNKEGAAFGWDASLAQLTSTAIGSGTTIRGLFLAGHWCLRAVGQSGIPAVSLSGRNAAEAVLKMLDRQWEYGNLSA